MEDYADRCIIKLFDIPRELIIAITDEYESDTLTVDIDENNKDIRLTITNYAHSDEEFFNLVSRINGKFVSYIYSDEDITLEECLVKKLTKLSRRISVAESLTGGIIASRVVSVSGASRVFYEGLVTYVAGSKVRRLHVPLPIINAKGMVNEEVSRAMAKGLFDSKETDFVLSTTGIAGPLTDEFNTPVGRVYISYGDKNEIRTEELNLEGTRDEIRNTTANYALFFMLRFINNKYQ